MTMGTLIAILQNTGKEDPHLQTPVQAQTLPDRHTPLKAPAIQKQFLSAEQMKLVDPPTLCLKKHVQDVMV